jgi:hypothetical protein
MKTMLDYTAQGLFNVEHSDGVFTLKISWVKSTFCE